ncbi:hypothetical protein [Rhizohabitans arisaemae]|uniref:hypothetical protein n=1 Tax=Rhizohabitans arisaemae TaxID=2720610 RepID=UPI0024B1CB94|nr:hypothetical protein [Rhizohabitans arisaemae]
MLDLQAPHVEEAQAALVLLVGVRGLGDYSWVEQQDRFGVGVGVGGIMIAVAWPMPICGAAKPMPLPLS